MTDRLNLSARVVTSLRETRPYVTWVAAGFAVCLLAGYAGSDLFAEGVRRFLHSVRQGAIGSYWSETGKTFFHNAVLDYLAMRLGYATYGLVPGAFVALNGLMAGAFLGCIVPADRFGALGLLLPHGAFELPALFVAAGLGIWLGTAGRKQPGLREGLRRAHAVFLTVILPLSLMAAAIESWEFTGWRPRFDLPPAPTPLAVDRPYPSP